ncbi:MAG: zinc-ribbon domain-containing protein [Lachnospira eligens]
MICLMNCIRMAIMITSLERATKSHFIKNIMRREQLMKCNNCGAPIQMNQKFCPNCARQMWNLRSILMIWNNIIKSLTARVPK